MCHERADSRCQDSNRSCKSRDTGTALYFAAFLRLVEQNEANLQQLISVTQSHRFTYNEPMPVESCTQSLCDLALRFGEDSDDAGGMVSMVEVGKSEWCSHAARVLVSHVAESKRMKVWAFLKVHIIAVTCKICHHHCSGVTKCNSS